MSFPHPLEKCVREVLTGNSTDSAVKAICAAWLEGWVQGRAAGYRLGYDAGLFALEGQVPSTVYTLWKNASLEAKEYHFKVNKTWLSIAEAQQKGGK